MSLHSSEKLISSHCLRALYSGLEVSLYSSIYGRAIFDLSSMTLRPANGKRYNNILFVLGTRMILLSSFAIYFFCIYVILEVFVFYLGRTHSVEFTFKLDAF